MRACQEMEEAERSAIASMIDFLVRQGCFCETQGLDTGSHAARSGLGFRWADLQVNQVFVDPDVF